MNPFKFLKEYYFKFNKNFGYNDIFNLIIKFSGSYQCEECLKFTFNLLIKNMKFKQMENINNKLNRNNFHKCFHCCKVKFICDCMIGCDVCGKYQCEECFDYKTCTDLEPKIIYDLPSIYISHGKCKICNSKVCFNCNRVCVDCKEIYCSDCIRRYFQWWEFKYKKISMICDNCYDPELELF